VLGTKRGEGALDWQQDAKYLWRPDLRPKLKDRVPILHWPGKQLWQTWNVLRAGDVSFVLFGTGRL
jgi:hypothetical protein